MTNAIAAARTQSAGLLHQPHPPHRSETMLAALDER
eukprot:CAMPEP_0183476676 /NCGR_PEP_ID=MMETSP0370-20130417/166854_1 /TAXON_ID=268820 /ORGANISM="Peridinium aciculiferum, Strain PAER-2" /LENGTH=35 /DNA_ID= /DNA_START= /DNA_END= /DNA_ORIENTATION=